MGYADGSIRLFDIDKKNIVGKLQPFNKAEISALNHCKNSSILLAGNNEGQIAVIDLSQLITTRIIEDHKGAAINSLDSVYKSEKQLTCWLASSNDGRISVWHTKCNEDLFQMIDWINFSENVKTEANKVATSPCLTQFVSNSKGDTIAYVGYGGLSKKEILFYSISKKQVIRTMSLSEWPLCMAISSACNLIAFGTKSRLLQLKDYNQASFQDYTQHSDSVSSVCFSSDGKHLYSASYNEIFIWDIKV